MTVFFCSLCFPCLSSACFYLCPVHITDLLYLPQAPAGDCSHQRPGEGLAPLLVSLVTSEPS